jgi:protein phosphatase PTC2/3
MKFLTSDSCSTLLQHLQIVMQDLINHVRTDESSVKNKIPSDAINSKHALQVQQAMLDTYRLTDASMIESFASQQIHYSSCTSVTALLIGDLLTIAHLGDSKIVLGREHVVLQAKSTSNSAPTLSKQMRISGKYMTTDHKPDMQLERERIEANGGCLAYLHGGKPFIRGGDFTLRQSRGERPMQLNYSRAFGGKDLKMFGLSSVPDLAQIRISEQDKFLILASDGLWDVASADDACQIAHEAILAGRDPSMELTDWALHQHDMRGSMDNVTVIVAQFNHERN